MATIWGVDSASQATSTLLQCVQTNYGMPDFWGRYLSTVPQASEGLTRTEIQFLRQRGIKLLPIYNEFRAALGYQQGKVAAKDAISHARRLGIRGNTALFANVERFFKVNEAWLRGWVDTIVSSGYRPGFYHDPIRGDFSRAYCQAVRKNHKLVTQAIIWSAEPATGVTTKQNAPRSFIPKRPNCRANIWVWQYGRNSKTCPVDTNLADQRLSAYLS